MDVRARTIRPSVTGVKRRFRLFLTVGRQRCFQSSGAPSGNFSRTFSRNFPNDVHQRSRTHVFNQWRHGAVPGGAGESERQQPKNPPTRITIMRSRPLPALLKLSVLMCVPAVTLDQEDTKPLVLPSLDMRSLVTV